MSDGAVENLQEVLPDGQANRIVSCPLLRETHEIRLVVSTTRVGAETVMEKQQRNEIGVRMVLLEVVFEIVVQIHELAGNILFIRNPEVSVVERIDQTDQYNDAIRQGVKVIGIPVVEPSEKACSNRALRATPRQICETVVEHGGVAKSESSPLHEAATCIDGAHLLSLKKIEGDEQFDRLLDPLGRNALQADLVRIKSRGEKFEDNVVDRNALNLWNRLLACVTEVG